MNRTTIMSQKLHGMLNLSKANVQEYLFKNKAGETCIWVDAWLNDQPDQYGNTLSIQVSQNKEQREKGKIYLGNLKPDGGSKVQEAEVLPENSLPF